MNGTDRKILLDEIGLSLARVWKQISAPVKYSQPHYINGMWVRVTVGKDPDRNGDEVPHRRKTDADDTNNVDELRKSLIEDLMSDRSIDA